VLKIWGLLEEHYQPATANRMLAALRGVLRECRHAQLLTTDDYQAATSIPAVRGESEARGRDLSTGEVRGLIVIADGMANRRRIEEVRGAAQLSIGPDGPSRCPATARRRWRSCSLEVCFVPTGTITELDARWSTDLHHDCCNCSAWRRSRRRVAG
jgi:hypothetical protein